MKQNDVFRLARVSELVAGAAEALLVISALILLLVAFAGGEEADALLREELSAEGFAGPIPAGVRALAYGLGLPPVLVGLFATDRARALFAGYRRGEIFTEQAAARLVSIGWAVFALAPVTLTAQMCASLAVSAVDPVGGTHLAVDFGDGDLYAVVFGLLLVAVGRVLHQAAALAEENRAFV